jgi:hypothetical protein
VQQRNEKKEDSRASPNVLLLCNHPAPAEPPVADGLGAILAPLAAHKAGHALQPPWSLRDTVDLVEPLERLPRQRRAPAPPCSRAGSALHACAPRAARAPAGGRGSGTLPAAPIGTSRSSPGVNVAVVLANEMSDAREYENWSSSSEFHSLSDGVGSMYSPCCTIRCRSACNSFRRRLRSAGACRRGSSISWYATVG